MLLVDAGDAVDVNVDVALQGCAETALSMVCALVFVDGRPSETSPVVCPRIGEASSGSPLLLVRLPFATPLVPEPPPIPNLPPNERPAGTGGA